MESPQLIILKNAVQGARIPAAELHDALFRLDHTQADLAADLQIPFRGPSVPNGPWPPSAANVFPR